MFYFCMTTSFVIGCGNRDYMYIYSEKFLLLFDVGYHKYKFYPLSNQ